MKTPLAIHNLMHNQLRTLIAVAGVGFAVLLMFMQLGFRNTVANTATISYDAVDFDVCIRSQEYLHFVDARTFPRIRLTQARSVAGVTSVAPLYVGLQSWSRPQAENDARFRRGILIMGVDRDAVAFRSPELRRKIATTLETNRDALVDTQTRPEFGPAGRRFSDLDIGSTAEINKRQIRLAGTFEMGTGMSANGALLMNSLGFARVSFPRGLEQVSLGLVHIEEDANPDHVAQLLRSRLPEDVEVLTRQQVLAQERRYWVRDTSYGLIFTLGVVVAVIVGTAIVYQVLSSDVASLLPEYATLKAIGYSNGYLAKVIVTQALVLALGGFLPGLVLSLLLYRFTSWLASIRIEMNSGNLITVLILAHLMCLFSGLLTLRKVFRAEPANLF